MKRPLQTTTLTAIGMATFFYAAPAFHSPQPIPLLKTSAQASDLPNPNPTSAPNGRVGGGGTHWRRSGGRSGGSRSGGGTYFRMPTPPFTSAPTGRYRGGASRSVCSDPNNPAVIVSRPETAPPLTALVPFQEEAIPTAQPSTREEKITRVWGLTVSARPTFWFYVPYENLATNNNFVEFSLQDGDGNDVYRSQIVPTNQPGIISVRLPSTVELEVNKPYSWYFKIYCGQQKSGDQDFVNGTIQRVSLNNTIATQVASAAPLQKADLYAQNGIWYDSVTTLATLRYVKPQDSALIEDWNSLLQSIGLTDIASAPLIQCCQPKPQSQ